MTDDNLLLSADDIVADLLPVVVERGSYAQRRRRYFDGEHDQLIEVIQQRRGSVADQLVKLRDNLMPGVVRALTSRLHIESWTSDHQDEIEAIAARNRLPLLQKELHQEAALGGDAGLVVWPGADGKARFYPVKAGSFAVMYDPVDLTRLVSAMRVWSEKRAGKKYVCATVYTADELYDLVTKRPADELPHKADAWVVEDVRDNPYGTVPFFHLPNDGDLGTMGRSELDPAMPLQDALNLALINMKIGEEDVAWRQLVRIGAEVILDPMTGDVMAPKTGPGTVMDVGMGGDVKVLPGADMRPFLDEQESLRREIAAVTSTPLHMLSLMQGTPPSGDALDVLEKALTDKARDRQQEWTYPWSAAMALALFIDGVRAPGAEAEGLLAIRAVPQWAPPETTSEARRVELVDAKIRAGWPPKRAFMEAGYTEPEAEQLVAERAAHDEEQSARRAIDFDAGLVA